MAVGTGFGSDGTLPVDLALPADGKMFLRIWISGIEADDFSQLTPDQEITATTFALCAKAFTLIEPGPVTLVTTAAGRRKNIMTISCTVVMDFTPKLAFVTRA